MKGLRKKLSAFLIILGVVTWLSPILFRTNVYADNNILTISQLTNAEKTKIDKYVKNVNKEVKDDVDCGTSENILVWDKDANSGTKNGELIYNLTFAITEYNRKDYDCKVAIMEHLLNAIDDSEISTVNRTKIYNFIASNDEVSSSLIRQLSTDMRSDYAGAYLWFRPFSSPLSTFLGLVTLLIFALLGISILLDISYITIPMFQVLPIFSSSNGQDKPRFISTEAWAAIKTSESTSNTEYKSALGFYFHAKSKQLFALSLCILYLTSGKLYDILASFMNLLQGFLG